MIRLSNGHEFTFCAASGALGFDGRGWWWEAPLRWGGILRPQAFTIITKTLTFAPRAGNLRMWCPWRCVRLVTGGSVNAVGLTNMGYENWIEECYPVTQRMSYAIVVSINPVTVDQAATMALALEKLDIKGIEINLSCPSSKDSFDPVAVTQAVHDSCMHPLIVKLGSHNLDLLGPLSMYVEAFDLINTVPWAALYSDQPSPLARYGLTGGVSGRPIRELARDCLDRARKMTFRPIISGGGIDSLEEVLVRNKLGANAFSLGVVFLRAPWRPNRIVAEYSHRLGVL